MALLRSLIREVWRRVFAGNHSRLIAEGCDQQAAGRLPEAIQCFTRAISARPDAIDAYLCRGFAFMAQGQVANAMSDAVSALALDDSADAKSLFAACVKDVSFSEPQPAISRLLARALVETWCPPTQLARAAAALLKHDAAIATLLQRESAQRFPITDVSGLATHDLFLALLTTTPVCDVDLERLLTQARHALLDRVGDKHDDESLLEFGAALAIQCFVNEYVFDVKNDELQKATALRQAVQRALASCSPIDAFDLISVASYFPLHTLERSEQLCSQRWPPAVEPLLTQQIREPAEERRLASSIVQITAIDNRVSKLVRNQYEQNPYPRWIRTTPVEAVDSLDAFLAAAFPNARRQPADSDGRIDILMAGCGTGEHLIHVASRYPRASVLAIDLSLASLSYAKRKTNEMGIGNVEYAQADILELAALGRRFHLIETAGVLHHLDDPLAGWRVLLRLLKPGGVMEVAVYSERGREPVRATRQFIAEKGYAATPADIRRCRAEMMASQGSRRWRLESPDFFSLSACRDLLFHVQERPLTLPAIKAFLAESRLHFLGFDLPDTIRAQYQERFPDDPALTDLEHWHLFESASPSTFAGMYRFCVQSVGMCDTSPV